MSRSSSEIKAKGRWRFIVVGIIIMMCLGTVYSYSIFRPFVEQIYEIGTTKSGLPYMFSLVFYALFMLLAGKYVEKYSPKIITRVGAVLVGGGWFLSGYAGNVYILTLTYGVLIGAGVGIIYGVPLSVAAKWFPEKKGLFVGAVLIGFGLSPFVTAPFAQYLIGHYGLLQSFRILGLIFLVCLFLLSGFLEYPLKTEDNSTSNLHTGSKEVNTKSMVKSKVFKNLYLNFIIGTMIGLLIVGMTGNVGVELIGLPSATVSLLISFFAVFNGIGRPLFGWLVDKVTYKKAMRFSYVLIIIAAFFMIMAQEGSLVLYIIGFSIFWLNLGGWLAIAPAATMALFGSKYYSRNYGVVFSAYGFGALAGVLISGALKDRFSGYQAIFYLILILCITGLFLSKKGQKDSS